MTDSRDAFVILPFEEDFEDLYEEKISPILEDEGYNVNKADSIDSQRAIIQDIINGITNANLIVADLTGKNPNVFYELGIAHGLGVPTVLIAQDINELPFDLAAYKTIEYSLKFSEIDKFAEELSEVAENHSNGDLDFGSPVSDYSSVDITYRNYQEREGDEINDRSEGDDDEVLIDGNQPDKSIPEYMSEINNFTSRLQDEFEYTYNEFDQIDSEISRVIDQLENSSPIEDALFNRKKHNSLSRDLIESLSKRTHEIETKTEKIENNTKSLMNTTQSFIKYHDTYEEEHLHVLKELLMGLDEFIHNTERLLDKIGEMKRNLYEIGTHDSDLSYAAESLDDEISKLESILREGIAKAERFQSLINNDIEEIKTS